MASHFMPAKPSPVVHSAPVTFGKPVSSGPSHSTSSGSYKTQVGYNINQNYDIIILKLANFVANKQKTTVILLLKMLR